MRAFIALPLPREVQAVLSRTINQLERLCGRAVRFVPAGQIHLTVKFLGDIDEGQAPQITAGLRALVASYAPWPAQLQSKLGAFPNSSAPRVIWVGVEDGGNAVTVQRSVEDALDGFGFEQEQRQFTPHLTLGRRRPGKDSGRLQGRAMEGVVVEPISFFFDRLVFFQSILAPSGAIHKEISVHVLGRPLSESV